MHTAVLFLIFNRPDSTQKVFEAIRQVKPPRLYVAADGPRINRIGERERCEDVRRIATAVDWPCEVKTLLRDENLGCKYSVSSAISWFFDNEEEGIILEDDVLPAFGFFNYCEMLLEYYRDKSEIMMISGCNPVSGQYKSSYSYDFSIYGLVWGWATWKRAWKLYDVDLKKWPSVKKEKQLMHVPKVNKIFEVIWSDIYEKTYLKHIDTWDYQWFFAININHSFIILPKINMVENIGYGEDATHAYKAIPKWVSSLKAGNAPLKYVHPSIIENNEEIDRSVERIVFGVNRFTYIKSVVKQILGPRNLNNIIYIKTTLNKILRRSKG